MRKHTKEFKSSISTFGRELDSKITVLGTELILEKEDLFSITPITNSTLLKTVMKEVDFESKKQIGIGQEINVKSGVKVNGEYEYIDYGNYSVYKSEYKAETDTYSHICYDKMLKTMIDYTPLDITYPINLREYINAIATKCGLGFADKNSAFANYNTSINEDHFSNGNYTFRDVLDYIAQLVGGWLCINDNDELEIRYPSQAKNYESDSGEEINFYTEVEDKIKELTIYGNSIQETTTGANLIGNKNNDVLEKNGLTFTKNSDGSVTVNGTSTALTWYVLVDKKDYDDGNYYVYVKTTDNKLTFYMDNPIGICTNSKIVSLSSYKQKDASLRIPSGATLNNAKIYFMLAKSYIELPYEPYTGGQPSPSPDYPSEIESVKDTIQVKDVGKNLYNDNFSDYTRPLDYLIHPITLEQGQQYTLKATLTGTKIPGILVGIVPTGEKYADFKNRLFVAINSAGNTEAKRTITIDETWTSPKLVVYCPPSSLQTTFESIFENYEIQLEKGTQATTYEPYQENTLNIDLQGNELCSLPNNVKDELVIENGRAKIIKRIGKVVLDGSESGWLTEIISSTNKNAYINISNAKGTINAVIYCNYFKYEQNMTTFGQVRFGRINNNLIFYNGVTEFETLQLWKSWLSTHPTEVIYELAEPYTVDLGEVNTLSTFKGVNNVSLDTSMQTNMTITYPTEYEELDKHFLKDVNVSFSKKYGAVNSVVFSRGNGSDNIYRKDNASINKNGLTEIKIADNPFLEGDDRENFIQSLFDKINGLEFYIMDVASTGIMYLELGDFYYFNMVEEKPSLKSGLVKSGMRKAQGSSGGKFLCLLMNDEIKITQGLEESIYSDEPEITETDYKTASITDTSIKNAIIQTNKNSAEILLKVNSDEVVSAINLSPENIKISSAKLDIDAIATFTNSKLAEAGSTIINGANITTGSISCDRLKGGTLSGQKIVGGSISITTGNYYFNMGTSTSNPNCSGLNVGSYGVKAYSDITATGFAITDSDTGKSGTFILRHSNGTSVVYLTFTGGILTAYDQLD